MAVARRHTLKYFERTRLKTFELIRNLGRLFLVTKKQNRYVKKWRPKSCRYNLYPLYLNFSFSSQINPHNKISSIKNYQQLKPHRHIGGYVLVIYLYFLSAYTTKNTYLCGKLIAEKKRKSHTALEKRKEVIDDRRGID